MNIWLFRWDEPLPFDQSARLRRAGLLATELLARGHQVTWWTTNFNHFAKKTAYKPDEILLYKDNLKIVALKSLTYKKNASLVRLYSQAVSARHFQKMQRQFPKPDIMIVHYPSIDLAYAAVRFAIQHNIPVIVDVRDMWPDTFIRLLPPSVRRLVQFFLRRSFRMKQYVFSKANVLLSMSYDILDWAIQSSGRIRSDLDNVFYLGAPRSRLAANEVRPEITKWLADHQQCFICSYIGTFGKSYSLLSIVDAAKALAAEGDLSIAFVLAGDGPDFAAVSQAASGIDSLFLPGWINSSESAAILKNSQAALIPINNTTPEGVMCNKLFDYAASGVPIISSVDGEMRRFVDEHRIGLFYHDQNISELILAIRTLRQSPVETSEMGRNSQNVFDEKLDASKIYRQYADLVETVFYRQNN